MAAVQMDEGGQAEQVVSWGPLPTNLPAQRMIARAELYGILVVLRSCLPPVRIHVDCELILKGIARGRRWCTYSKRPHADIWKKIWSALADIGIGEDGATFLKVRAHVARGRAQLEEAPARRVLAANAAADAWAKEGAAEGTNIMLRYVAQAVGDQAEKVKGALDLTAGLAKEVLSKEERWPDVTPLPRREPRARSPRCKRQEARPHKWGDRHFGQQCRRCYRVATADDRKAVLDKAGREGHAVATLALDDIGPFVVVNGHKLWQTGPYVWCALCGSHSHLRVRALARKCRGGGRCVAGTGAGRASLRAGRAPTARPDEEPVGAPARLTLQRWLQWTGFVLADGEDEVARLCKLLQEQEVVGDAEPEAA